MANLNDKQKTFKISDLVEIDKSNIDDQDSFLITDYHGKERITRRISIKKLIEVFSENPSLISSILADEKIEQKIDDRISSATIDI